MGRSGRPKKTVSPPASTKSPFSQAPLVPLVSPLTIGQDAPIENTCQNLGHNCAKPKGQVKHWKPKAKLPAESSPTDVAEGSTFAPVPHMVPMFPVDEGKWSVAKRGKDKGKMQSNDVPPAKIFRDNGFDALEILDDLLELQNLG
ncbi:unnamed protein product [Vicia faba]|uniref:Uncharacterized protein n=1 Tax=Vicia faba TaxID=3906 RepID=A0AAV0YQ91_VICFA|nr:unnamed protein product [Vicia faba]